LPFLFANRQQAYEVLDGPIGQELLRKLETVNLVGLAYAERGFRNLTNSKKEIRVPADLRGLRIRVMQNPVYIDTFRTLGANTVPMAWTEALTALQQRTIDGQENPINVIHSFKLNETQKFLSLTRHTYAPALFVMSRRVFQRFPKAQQDLLVKAAQEASAHVRKVNEEMESAQLAELRTLGMQVIEPDINAFKEAVGPVYAKYEKTFGDYLKRINAGLK
jgi:tripartite ATP-independent transporter DctP family solute receptor